MTSLAKITSGMGSGLIAAGAPFILAFLYGTEYDPKGYFVLAAAVSVLMFLGGLFVYLWNRERVVIISDFISFKDLVRSIFQNDQLIAYFISFILINMAGALTNNFAVYFFAFDYGDLKYYGIFTIIAGLGQGIAVFTYPLIAKRLTVRAILIIATLSAVIGYALMMVIMVLFGAGNIIILCAVSALMLFSGGWLATASQSMLVDITDYGEYKLGNRTGSVIFSANTMMWRIIGSVIVLSLGLTLSAAGINGVNLQGDIPEIAPSGLWLLRTMMFGVPILFMSAGLIVFLKYYILNEKEMAKIQDSLDERREKAEEKRRLKEEIKLLKKKLKEEKRVTRLKKKFKTEHKSFKRTKKVSIERAKKRLSLFKDDNDDNTFDIK
jgi:Na+/melibiose symporter-like transporter